MYILLWQMLCSQWYVVGCHVQQGLLSECRLFLPCAGCGSGPQVTKPTQVYNGCCLATTPSNHFTEQIGFIPYVTASIDWLWQWLIFCLYTAQDCFVSKITVAYIFQISMVEVFNVYISNIFKVVINTLFHKTVFVPQHNFYLKMRIMTLMPEDLPVNR